MANLTSQYLKPDAEISLRDWQHAARLFTDDSFRLAPKHKFLFHVAFSINPAALQTIDLAQRHRNEINMLVKSADLPSYKVTAETANQYNRKKVIQTTHTYTPISIKFHDDNMGIINRLWQNYYSYYYADSTSATKPGAYNRNATRNSNFINNPYGLDNRSTLPFFNYITIYQMARREYVSYKLWNPVISSWNHNKVDYAQNTVHDNDMSIMFEAVSYGSGTVQQGDPEGFALEHYDQATSPLTLGGNISSSSPSTANASAVTNNAGEFAKSVTEQINNYQNTQQLTQPGTPGVLNSIVQTATQGVNGVQGILFPVKQDTTNTIVASPINLRG